MSLATILVIDDEPSVRERLEELIVEFGHLPITAEDGMTARAQLQENNPDLVIADLNLPDTTGINILREIRTFNKQIPVAIITGYASVDTAVEAIQDGAFDYLPKPFKMDDLEKVINKGLRLRKGLQDPTLVAPFCRQRLFFAFPSRPTLIASIMTVTRQTLENSWLSPDDMIQDLCLCLEEAIVNAVFHGNKLDDSKKVTVSVEISSEKIRLTVEDEGEGFDFLPYTDSNNIQDIMSNGGHGLFLMLCLMDEIRFNKVGNAVSLLKLIVSGDKKTDETTLTHENDDPEENEETLN
ncbi:response regulator [Acidobacteriota bacterium]